MKLDIIYRCCEQEVEGRVKEIRPTWFNKINCLQTFIEAIKQAHDLLGEIIFLHDGPKGKLYNAIPKQYTIKEVNYMQNELSLLETFKIADSLNENIYFVEDDYLHLPNSIRMIASCVDNFKLLTGYDHLDRYKRTDDITINKETIAFSRKSNCHWRTAESTCCTWATTRELWRGVIGILAKEYKLRDREFFRALYTKHNIRLWSPIPGVTTQVDQCLSPGIDWEKI